MTLKTQEGGTWVAQSVKHPSHLEISWIFFSLLEISKFQATGILEGDKNYDCYMLVILIFNLKNIMLLS